MDKIALLDSRKKQAELLNASALGFAREILDEESFVETDSFYFAGNDLTDNGTLYGEGVVCGSGTVNGIPVCLFVQNYEVMKGGLSKGQADKIVKIMDQADRAGLPLIAAVHTAGARLGEGIRVLDGYARVLRRFAELRGQIPLVTVVKGETYGLFSAFAPLADFTFVLKDGVLATTSPAILTAKAGLDKSAAASFGAAALDKKGRASRVCKDAAALRSDLGKLFDLLAGGETHLTDAELNLTCPALNKGYDPKTVATRVFDKNTFFELNAGCAPEVCVGLARLGGVTVGAVLCSAAGEDLTAPACRKIGKFNEYLDNNGIPLVTFLNASGFAADYEHENCLLNARAKLFAGLATGENLKICVACGEVAGSVYATFLSKEIVDASFVWATASVSVLGKEQGAELDFAADIKNAANREKARQKAAEKYAEIAGDVFAAVECGSVDEVIEPALTRSYLLSVLCAMA